MHQSLVFAKEAAMERISMASARTADPVKSGKPVARSGTFVLNGEYWTIGYGGANFSLRNVLGLSYIHRLLVYPDQEFHALDLLADASPGTTSQGPRTGSELRTDEQLTVRRTE